MDEFLLSDKVMQDFGKYAILKLKYNENIDFLYRPKYYNFEYNRDLEFIGIFDRKHMKVYGNYFFKIEDDRCSSFYNGEIDNLKISLYEELNNLLKKYIDENKDKLIEVAKTSFEKLFLEESHLDEIKKVAIDHYIYSIHQNEYIYSFEIPDFKEKENSIMLEYIQNPKETVDSIFNEYINNEERYNDYKILTRKINNKEKIGYFLLKNQIISKTIDEISAKPDKIIKKKRDIFNAIKYVEAQLLTIKLKSYAKTLIFKYPKNSLSNFYFNSWNVHEAKLRDEIEKMYGGLWKHGDEFFMDIESISYRGKTVYEDSELLEKEVKSNENVVKK